MTKRTLHLFAQQAEQALERSTVDRCPDPSVAQKIHPFSKEARRKGDRSLRMQLVSKFLCRGAGYVSVKDEKTLSELDIVADKSTLALRTASEYVARLLLKTEQTVQNILAAQEMRCLNFCFDGATIASQQASDAFKPRSLIIHRITISCA